ncbi:hypothetical protein DPMN_041155 [Dreissena polymorpha]|uniref:Uncharacterized protein n=1 Tax=Dreissena polymorpha TaxID=45954 RepID=A0A9D4HXL8_DREPO|nr:hypothetical protein DPMN_041155 [Dreissena polymorpha]
MLAQTSRWESRHCPSFQPAFMTKRGRCQGRAVERAACNATTAHNVSATPANVHARPDKPAMEAVQSWQSIGDITAENAQHEVCALHIKHLDKL